MNSQQFKRSVFTFATELGFAGTGKIRHRPRGECMQYFQFEMHPRTHTWRLVFGVSYDVATKASGTEHCPLQFWLGAIPHDITKHSYVNNCLLDPANESVSDVEKIETLKHLILTEIEPVFNRLLNIAMVAKEYAAGNLNSVPVRYDLLEAITELNTSSPQS